MTGDCWSLPEIGVAELSVHPRHLIDEDLGPMMTLWAAWRGGMGAGPLPEAGGLLNQAACTMASLAVALAADAALSRKTDR